MYLKKTMPEINIEIPEPAETPTIETPIELAVEVGKTSAEVDNVQGRIAKLENDIEAIKGMVSSIPTPTPIDYDAIRAMIREEVEIEEDIDESEVGLLVEELPEPVAEEEPEEPKKTESKGILRTAWNFIY